MASPGKLIATTALNQPVLRINRQQYAKKARLAPITGKELCRQLYQHLPTPLILVIRHHNRQVPYIHRRHPTQ